MRNLLAAGLFRLWRSKSFYATLAVMAAVGAIEPILGYTAMLDLAAGGAADAFISLDSRYLLFPFLSGILLSVFCALFVGAEHSDGAMRNKLAAGHRRGTVYLSNLILCVTAGILLCLGYIAAVLAVGIPLLGPLRIPLPLTLWYTFCSVIMTCALAAVFTLAAMLCQNKAVTAVACISLAYFLLFLGIFLNSRLVEPEIQPERQYVEEGQIVGTVTEVTFKGMHYDIIVDFQGFKWLIQTTDYSPEGARIGVKIDPDGFHIMRKSQYSGMFGDYSSYSAEYDELNEDVEGEDEE